MTRALLITTAVLLFGCNKNAPAAPDASTVNADPTAPVRATGTPPADSAPAPAPTVTGEGTATETMAGGEGGESEVMDAPAPTNGGGGRMAKPGWCNKDEDCSKGQVCEKCGAEGQCVPGCHNSAQCAADEYCNQVQCIRCPCPGICEKKS